MNLSNIAPASGAVRNNTRRGRGTGSGKGGTSARGHKGAQSRSGYKRKIGFEGGQMPLQRRVPKFGFTNIDKVYYRVVNLDQLTELAAEYPNQTLNVDFFVQHGLAAKKDVIKVLGRGEVNSAITVEAHAFSASAKENIEKAGGKATAVKSAKPTSEKAA